jgi:hypothetical protein
LSIRPIANRATAVERHVFAEQLLQRTFNQSVAVETGRVTNRDGEIGGLRLRARQKCKHYNRAEDGADEI